MNENYGIMTNFFCFCTMLSVIVIVSFFIAVIEGTSWNLWLTSLFRRQRHLFVKRLNLKSHI
jgi:hypothetical protein